MLEIYNTLSRRKEPFTPINPQNVRMYVCGMTVYDFCHLGHARVLVVFDIVSRYLRRLYGDKHVTYVRNVTDIDDKIIKRANENQETHQSLTQRFIAEMHQDAAALGVLPPDVEPCATHHMDEIIRMIGDLITRDFAYAAANGDVFYDISKFTGYGRLSGKQVEDLRSGARVEVDTNKRDPLDFVLWKAVKPGEPAWDSPWGAGRPGWHIECSAMSTHCLGNHFDIHGGGMDLQFPHHENEIAQSEGASGVKFVNVWMHNGFVRVDDEKMSKSLGNFFTIREILERYDAEVVRYFILGSQYRSPLNYSDQHLDAARSALSTLYTALRHISAAPAAQDNDYSRRFYAAMDDDFNTPEAMAVLFDLAREVNRVRESDAPRARELAAQLRFLGGELGLLGRDASEFLQGGDSTGVDAEHIEALIARRNQARADRDFAEADRIRDELDSLDVVLEDGAGGTTWRKK